MKLNHITKVYKEQRHGKISYRVFYNDAHGVRHSKRFKTEAEAEKFREQMSIIPEEREDLFAKPEAVVRMIDMIMELKGVTKIKDVYACLNATLVPNLSVCTPFALAAEEFLRWRRQQGKRQSTMAIYEQVFERIKTVGKKATLLLIDCNMDLIQQVVSTREDGKARSASGMDRVLILLSAFFNWAVKMEYLPKSPLSKTYINRKGSNSGYNAKVIHPIAMNIIMESLKGTEHEVVFALLAFAGIRPMEIIHQCKYHDKVPLKWTDIDPKLKAITIRRDNSKTHHQSTFVGTPSRLWDVLLQYNLLQFTRDEYVGYMQYQFTKVKNFLNEILTIAEKEFIKAGGILYPKQSFTITRDILRHSFVSYAIHYIGLIETAKISRHSLSIMQSNYIGIATEDDAKVYFEGMDVSCYLQAIVAERGSYQINIPVKKIKTNK